MPPCLLCRVVLMLPCQVKLDPRFVSGDTPPLSCRSFLLRMLNNLKQIYITLNMAEDALNIVRCAWNAGLWPCWQSHGRLHDCTGATTWVSVLCCVQCCCCSVCYFMFGACSSRHTSSTVVDSSDVCCAAVCLLAPFPALPPLPLCLAPPIPQVHARHSPCWLPA